MKWRAGFDLSDFVGFSCVKSLPRGLTRHFDAVLSRVTFVPVTIVARYEPIVTFVSEPTTAPLKLCRSEELFNILQ